jgi:hypothetical protein
MFVLFLPGHFDRYGLYGSFTLEPLQEMRENFNLTDADPDPIQCLIGKITFCNVLFHQCLKFSGKKCYHDNMIKLS